MGDRSFCGYKYFSICEIRGYLYMILIFKVQVIIPCRMTKDGIHEQLGQFFDLLVTKGMKNRVMIAYRDSHCAGNDGNQMDPRKRDLPENSLPRNKADQSVQTEHRENSDAAMDSRAERHFRRSDQDRLTDGRVLLYKEYPAPGQFPRGKDQEDARRRQPHPVGWG